VKLFCKRVKSSWLDISPTSISISLKEQETKRTLFSRLPVQDPPDKRRVCVSYKMLKITELTKLLNELQEVQKKTEKCCLCGFNKNLSEEVIGDENRIKNSLLSVDVPSSSKLFSSCSKEGISPCTSVNHSLPGPLPHRIIFTIGVDLSLQRTAV
jgi:hypothetical protein